MTGTFSIAYRELQQSYGPCWLQGSVEGLQSISQQLARDYNTHATAVLQPRAPGGPAAAAGSSATAAAGGKGGGGAAEKVKVATADASEEEVQRMYENMGESWGQWNWEIAILLAPAVVGVLCEPYRPLRCPQNVPSFKAPKESTIKLHILSVLEELHNVYWVFYW